MPRPPGHRIRGRLTRRLPILTALLLALALPGASARAETVPEGAALWYACTQPSFSGPAPLRCPRPYDPRYLQTFLSGFDRLTPENEFKMAFLEPGQNQFDFALADQIATFARAHGKTIRGHTLIWNRELPPWVTNPLLPWNPQSLSEVMSTYISTVVGHFASVVPGVVREWDVVNEPLDAQGNLAPNLWESVIGPDYVRQALVLARRADPVATLVLNEQGADAPSPKSLALLALVAQLRREGAPLDTVGFEAHVTPAGAPPLSYLVWLMGQYAKLGVNVEITELDVDDDGLADDPAAKQAVFRRYADACHISRNCTGLTVWGVADPYSWLGPGRDALLYDESFHAKPVAGVLRHLLRRGSLATAAAQRRARRGRAAARRARSERDAARRGAARVRRGGADTNALSRRRPGR